MADTSNPAVWSLAGSALTGVVTLVGIGLTQRGSSARDLSQRAWEKRADLYLDLVQWSMRARDAVHGPDNSLNLTISVAEVEAIDMATEMFARVQAFASDRVRNAMGAARAALFMLKVTIAEPDPTDDDLLEATSNASSRLHALTTTIRSELAKYTRKPPIRERLQTLGWRLHRRWLRWRNRRRARRLRGPSAPN
ncbi:hypothetical protein SAMN04487968_11718 [Nocardioides terrae]|uniref:Uncharacterized protein n=1 Tax=Nocardioides terrae TaxID=574651 RepID=A0A1I1NQ05_9ACTN|nr:hypothetical protein [Nocardioides terrae]SFC96843.1 hypothetical protein SAMN04487968_11718 [Nocardioides terrae]